MVQITVAEKKHSFLRQQKHILSRDIPPSNRLYKIADRASIQQEVVSDVMHTVNQKLKRHSKLVYSRQMTDHVVEKIDNLYWEVGATHTDADIDGSTDLGDDDGNRLYCGDDLTLDKNITKLPTTWDTSVDPPPTIEEEEIDQDAYMTAHARLESLSAKRLTMQQKLSTYKTLLSLLEPYRDPKENVQPSLVNKDGPLASELTMTKTLAFRVATRMNEKYGDVQVPATAEDEDVDMIEAGNAKLNQILSAW
ncbi:kinetochore Sim4 complex subunit Fta4 [Lophiotrema nucula]|uniref:Kinetochore Sim4 complex subunit Fta4 n=1 Tax=Lophiotrema nucula TaxID=690887 RepID=A0A6A5ZT90_9PLEO|nr:kinetochore Sim4 complex subunit Fta4 [Lophiotrema nucula]